MPVPTRPFQVGEAVETFDGPGRVLVVSGPPAAPLAYAVSVGGIVRRYLPGQVLPVVPPPVRPGEAIAAAPALVGLLEAALARELAALGPVALGDLAGRLSRLAHTCRAEAEGRRPDPTARLWRDR